MKDLNDYINKYKVTPTTPQEKVKNGVNHSVADQKYDDADADKQTAFDNKAKEGITLVDKTAGENKDKEAVDKLLKEIKDAYDALNGNSKLQDKKDELTNKLPNNDGKAHTWNNLKKNQTKLLTDLITKATTLSALETLNTKGDALNTAMGNLKTAAKTKATVEDSLKYNYSEQAKAKAADTAFKNANTFLDDETSVISDVDAETKAVTDLNEGITTAVTQLNGTVEQAKDEFANFKLLPANDQTTFKAKVTDQTTKTVLDQNIVSAFNKIKENAKTKVESLNNLKPNEKTEFLNKITTAEITKAENDKNRIFAKIVDSVKTPYDSKLVELINQAAKQDAKNKIDSIPGLTDEEKDNLKKEIDKTDLNNNDNDAVADKIADLINKAETLAYINNKAHLNKAQKDALKTQVNNADTTDQETLAAQLNKIKQTADTLDQAMEQLENEVNKYRPDEKTPASQITNGVKHDGTDIKYNEADPALKNNFDAKVKEGLDLTTTLTGENKSSEDVNKLTKDIQDAYKALNGDTKVQNKKDELNNKFPNNDAKEHAWSDLKANQIAKLKSEITKANTVAELNTLNELGDKLNAAMKELKKQNNSKATTLDSLKYNYATSTEQSNADTAFSNANTFLNDVTTPVTDLNIELQTVTTKVNDIKTKATALSGTLAKAQAEFDNFNELSNADKKAYKDKIAENTTKSELDREITNAFEQVRTRANNKLASLTKLDATEQTKYKEQITSAKIQKQVRTDDKIFALVNNNIVASYDKELSIILKNAIKDNAKKIIDSLTNLTDKEKKDLKDKINILDDNNDVIEEKINDLVAKAEAKDLISGKQHLNNSQKDALKSKVDSAEKDQTKTLQQKLDEIVAEADNLDQSMENLDNYINKYKVAQNTPQEKVKNGVNHSVADQKYDEADTDKQTAFDNKSKEGITLVDKIAGENKDKAAVDKLLKEIQDAYDALNGNSKLQDKKDELTKNVNKDSDAKHSWNNLKANQKAKLVTEINNAKTVEKLNELETLGNNLDDKMGSINTALNEVSTVSDSIKYNYADSTAQKAYDDKTSEGNTFKADTTTVITDLNNELTAVNKLGVELTTAKINLNGTIADAQDEFDNFNNLTPTQKQAHKAKVTKDTTKSALDNDINAAFNETKVNAKAEIAKLTDLPATSITAYETKIDNANLTKASRTDNKIFAKVEDGKKVPYDNELPSILDAAAKENTKEKAKKEVDKLTDLSQDEKDKIKTEIDNLPNTDSQEDLANKAKDLVDKAKAKNEIAGKENLNNAQKDALKTEVDNAAKTPTKSLEDALKEITKKADDLDKSMKEVKDYVDKYQVGKDTPKDKIKNNVNHETADQKYDDADSDKQTAFDKKVKEGIDLVDKTNGTNRDKDAVDKLLKDIKDAYDKLDGVSKLDDKKDELTKNANKDKNAKHAWNNLKENQKAKLLADIAAATTLEQLTTLETTGNDLDSKMGTLNQAITDKPTIQDSLAYNYATITNQNTYNGKVEALENFKADTAPVTDLASEITKVNKLNTEASTAKANLNGTIADAQDEFDNFNNLTPSQKQAHKAKVTKDTTKSALDNDINAAFNETKVNAKAEIAKLTDLPAASITAYETKIDNANLTKTTRTDNKIFAKVQNGKKVPYDNELPSILDAAAKENTKEKAKKEVDKLTDLSKDEKVKIKKEIDNLPNTDSKEELANKAKDLVDKAKAKNEIAGKQNLNNAQKDALKTEIDNAAKTLTKSLEDALKEITKKADDLDKSMKEVKDYVDKYQVGKDTPKDKIKNNVNHETANQKYDDADSDKQTAFDKKVKEGIDLVDKTNGTNQDKDAVDKLLKDIKDAYSKLDGVSKLDDKKDELTKNANKDKNAKHAWNNLKENQKAKLLADIAAATTLEQLTTLETTGNDLDSKMGTLNQAITDKATIQDSLAYNYATITNQNTYDSKIEALETFKADTAPVTDLASEITKVNKLNTEASTAKTNLNGTVADAQAEFDNFNNLTPAQKQAHKAKVTKDTTKSALDSDINAAFNETKVNAKAEIAKLTDLPATSITAYETQIDNANLTKASRTDNKIFAKVENNKKVPYDNELPSILDAAAKENTKEKAKKEVDKLTDLSQDEKDKIKTEIDNLPNTDSKEDLANKAKDLVDKAKAKNEIAGKQNLNNAQKDALKTEVDNAAKTPTKSLEDTLKEITKKADDLDKSMKEVKDYVDKYQVGKDTPKDKIKNNVNHETADQKYDDADSDKQTAFDKKVKEGIDLVDKTNGTNQDKDAVDKLLKDIKDAYSNLDGDKKPVVDPNKAVDDVLNKLKEQIKKANETKDSDKYQEASKETKDNLDDKLNNANTVVNKPKEQLTPEEINKATNDLKDAIDKLEKEVQNKHDNDKNVIDQLPNLSQEEKDKLKDEYDQAKPEDKAKVVEKAKDLDKKKDDAIKEIEKLPNSNQDEKDELTKQIKDTNSIDNPSKVDEIVKDAKAKDKAKKDAIDEINKLPNLSDKDKQKFIDEINKYDSVKDKDIVKQIVDKAKKADKDLADLVEKVKELVNNPKDEKLLDDIKKIIDDLNKVGVDTSEIQTIIDNIIKQNELDKALEDFNNSSVKDDDFNNKKDKLNELIKHQPTELPENSKHKELNDKVKKDTQKVKDEARTTVDLIDSLINKDPESFNKVINDAHTKGIDKFDNLNNELTNNDFFAIANKDTLTDEDKQKVQNIDVSKETNVVKSAVDLDQFINSKPKANDQFPWWIWPSLGTAVAALYGAIAGLIIRRKKDKK
ncbi:hypothetical protein [Mycoplasma hafezii]|uniref:hypothetical protein n=1 Tax=Mycoplasma hafezii TaxID=525886 RepID=UPI003CF721A6